MNTKFNIEDLQGEVLTHIDICGEDEILLTTRKGKRIKVFHEQDCCEYVRIVGTDGDWSKLIGKPIIEATKEELDEDTEHGDHRTETILTFRVDEDTVISRWIGESNGYYSESVDIEEIVEKEDTVNINRQDTIRLLNMSYTLFKYSGHKEEPELDVPNSVARDLYDYIEKYTREPDILELMSYGRIHFKDRYKTLQYINPILF